MRACTNPACTYATTGVCANAARLRAGEACPDLGAVPGTEEDDSEEWEEEEESDADEGEPDPADTLWTGAALGLGGALDEGWHPDRRLFLVAGSEDAGKTCLLVATWVCLANRTPPIPWRFAGSWTLLGWQQLASKAFDWSGGGGRVLARTVADDARTAGFLHAELSRDNGETRTSVLLTDFPGEWFDLWVSDADAPRDRFDGFGTPTGIYFCVDLPRLRSGADYVEWSVQQAQLLHARWPRSPIAVVLTKCDQVGPSPDDPSKGWPEQVQRRLDKVLQALEEHAAPNRVFSTAAFHAPLAEGVPSGVMEPLLWLLDQEAAPALPSPVVLPKALPEATDYFAALEVTRERD